jgi:hypothetical protein
VLSRCGFDLMVKIFSYISWLVVCLLGNVNLGLLFILWLGFFFSIEYLVNSGINLWVLSEV